MTPDWQTRLLLDLMVMQHPQVTAARRNDNNILKRGGEKKGEAGSVDY